MRESPAGQLIDTPLTIQGLAGVTASPLKSVLTASAALDFASMLTLAQNDQNIAVVGARVNDPVFLGLPAAPTAGISFNVFVSAADVVTVRANNVSGGTVDPASATYRVAVLQF